MWEVALATLAKDPFYFVEKIQGAEEHLLKEGRDGNLRYEVWNFSSEVMRPAL